MKTLLITRPREQAEPLAGMLAARGFRVFTEPLLEIAPLPENTSALVSALARKPRAIVVTSRSALELAIPSPHRGEVGRGASSEKTEPPSPYPAPPPTGEGMAHLRGIPLFTVGMSAAEYVTGLGLECAGTCETAQALPALVEKHFTRAWGAHLLYLRGEDVSTDIAAELERKGFHVDSVVLYRAVAATEFSARLQSEMLRGGIAGALFFSRRTAETYARLARTHALEHAHRSMQAVCISKAVAQVLDMLPWQDIHIAEKPDMEHMLEALSSLTPDP